MRRSSATWNWLAELQSKTDYKINARRLLNRSEVQVSNYGS